MLIFLCTLCENIPWGWSWAHSIPVEVVGLEKLCPEVFLWHLEVKVKKNKKNWNDNKNIILLEFDGRYVCTKTFNKIIDFLGTYIIFHQIPIKITLIEQNY